jgi:hypothetical protein
MAYPETEAAGFRGEPPWVRRRARKVAQNPLQRRRCKYLTTENRGYTAHKLVCFGHPLWSCCFDKARVALGADHSSTGFELCVLTWSLDTKRPSPPPT